STLVPYTPLFRSLFYCKYRDKLGIIRKPWLCDSKTLFQKFICNCYERELLTLPFVYDALVKRSARLVALAGIEGAKKQKVPQFLIANLTDPATAAHAAARLADGGGDAHIATKLCSRLELRKTIGYHN